MNRLKDKVAIVTASTRGIGLATVQAFVAEGAKVYMAVRNPERGNEIAAELNAKGPGSVKVTYWEANEHERYEPMVDEVLADAGRIDILVNNYGGTKPHKDRDITACTWDNFSKDIQSNIGSVFIGSQLVINKAMSKQGGGVIINIGSIAGLTPDYKQCAYGVSKSGINHLTKMIAVQTARMNIRCNCVCPGMTATEAVTNNLPPEYQAVFMKNTPLVRMAKPEEIAAAVTYFASDDAAFTTGQVIAVEGGYSYAPGTYGDDIGAKVLEAMGK